MQNIMMGMHGLSCSSKKNTCTNTYDHGLMIIIIMNYTEEVWYV